MSNLITMMLAEVQGAGASIGADIQAEAALVWADIKKAVLAGEGVVVADAAAALPGFVAAVKAFAAQTVTSIQNDPAFTGALGQWKFGVAATRVLQAVDAGLPGFEQVAVTLGTATIETIVQAAFAAMVTSL